MNVTRYQLFRGIALAILFTVLQNAAAFHDPTIGKWINRDPIGEPGFQKIANVPTSRTTGEKDRYVVLANNLVNHIDALGLVKFEGCDADEQKAIEGSFAVYCTKIDSSAFKSCLNHCNLPARLKYMCEHRNELTVKCEKSSDGNCKDACAWSLPGGSTIHICPAQWGSFGCGPLGCTLLHEMTHMTGHGLEKLPQKVERCLGCE